MRFEEILARHGHLPQPQMRGPVDKAKAPNWYRIENSVDVADIWLYDEIGYFGITAQDFVAELQALKVDQINLHINSPGGEVYNGIAIYVGLKNHKARITTYVDGLAASAASFIAMAGDEIVMEKPAKLMIHDAHSIAIGDAAIMREAADLLDMTSDTIADLYAERAGGDAKAWRKAMKAETWYSAEEAVAAGLADRIEGVEADEDQKVAATWDLSIFARREAQAADPRPSDAPQFDPSSLRDAMKEVFA